MRPYIAETVARGDTYVSAYPNAGLPNEMATRLRRDAGHHHAPCGVRRERAGEHRRRLLRHDAGPRSAPSPNAVKPCRRARSGDRGHKLRLSGLEPLQRRRPESLFVNVGERTNVTGSARFRKLILNGNDYDEALAWRASRWRTARQVIDINMDEAMLDSEGRDGECSLNLVASEPDISGCPW
jgi:5-methyltetrahydrofolate--homocysteine methyltransferase